MKQPRIGLLLTGDLAAMAIAFVATLIFGFGGSVPTETILIHARPFSVLYGVWILIFYVFELYDVEYHRHGIQLYAKISQALLTALLASIAFFYILPFYGISPRTNLAINITVFGIFFLLWRLLFSQQIAKRFTIKTSIIDPKNKLQELENLLAESPQLGLGAPVRFLSASLIPADTQFVIVDANRLEAVAIEDLLNSPKQVMSSVSAYEQYFQKIPLSLVDTEWLVHNIKPRSNPFYRLVHAILDPIVAMVIILITLPVTLISALLIYLEDRGPIFYTQTRTGIYGKPFLIYKFRSMHNDAEKNGAEWSAGKKDLRITKIGKILRKLHIDEIPQMLNIIKGDIALIGPRAERPEFVNKLEQEIPHYRTRHMVKPGFTGWAQIKFLYARSVMDSYEKFQYDLYYIKNRNLIMDMAILVRTAYIIIKH